uniref:Uncharacterized protein n=1 Tax=Candidatus Kentrum sp. FW TaxID=2126338 RepID=A0A450TE38_9GAMM|nr:MAG: hypothetical protein BECKFW1821C_GA0114237_100727 [Candidatus Kentron sp. FW]
MDRKETNGHIIESFIEVHYDDLIDAWKKHFSS